jgi:phosphopantothenoylcysteine decarboxylase/phosphopantothenate--cysteine ligase
MIVAPLSANTLAKMATGIADNLLLTTILSARCPVYFAPAMDLDMYSHPTTRQNIKTLTGFGYRLIEPVEGELASGLKGLGRLEEPGNILEIILKDFSEKKVNFNGRKVLISAGPTYEAIDPVRFIGNHSSGKMGVEIAMAMAQAGAQVELVLGPSVLEVEHAGINIIRVTSAAEMFEQCVEKFPHCDLAIMSAAVADFTPEKVSNEKIKKENQPESIRLKPTKDILAQLGKIKTSKQFLVGFALETENALENALKKLKNKNLDLIVLNTLKDEGAGFGLDTNKITILSKTGSQKEFPVKNKKAVARDILEEISANIKK